MTVKKIIHDTRPHIKVQSVANLPITVLHINMAHETLTDDFTNRVPKCREIRPPSRQHNMGSAFRTTRQQHQFSTPTPPEEERNSEQEHAYHMTQGTFYTNDAPSIKWCTPAECATGTIHDSQRTWCECAAFQHVARV